MQYQYFNSTMVRLKATALQLSNIKNRFQFHYGTIKSALPQASTVALSYFNSTMVRLKDRNTCEGKGGSHEFQFHYGTIKSNSNYFSKIPDDISIPLWYD